MRARTPSILVSSILAKSCIWIQYIGKSWKGQVPTFNSTQGIQSISQHMWNFEFWRIQLKESNQYFWKDEMGNFSRPYQTPTHLAHPYPPPNHLPTPHPPTHPPTHPAYTHPLPNLFPIFYSIPKKANAYPYLMACIVRVSRFAWTVCFVC